MVEIITTDEWRAWYDSLDQQADKAVTASVELLGEVGVALGHPYSSAINGSKYPIRELRTQAGGRPLRTFYIFDPKRNAVLLLGGDKTGDERFYERMVPQAERVWEHYVIENS